MCKLQPTVLLKPLWTWRTGGQRSIIRPHDSFPVVLSLAREGGIVFLGLVYIIQYMFFFFLGRDLGYIWDKLSFQNCFFSPCSDFLTQCHLRGFQYWFSALSSAYRFLWLHELINDMTVWDNITKVFATMLLPRLFLANPFHTASQFFLKTDAYTGHLRLLEGFFS